jgi:hypothetical protein
VSAVSDNLNNTAAALCDACFGVVLLAAVAGYAFNAWQYLARHGASDRQGTAE